VLTIGKLAYYGVEIAVKSVPKADKPLSIRVRVPPAPMHKIVQFTAIETKTDRLR